MLGRSIIFPRKNVLDARIDRRTAFWRSGHSTDGATVPGREGVGCIGFNISMFSLRPRHTKSVFAAHFSVVKYNRLQHKTVIFMQTNNDTTHDVYVLSSCNIKDENALGVSRP